MTDLNIDLNITHYGIQELEDILNLKEDYIFKDIQSSSIIVRNKIFSVTSLDSFKKKEIKSAKAVIIQKILLKKYLLR